MACSSLEEKRRAHRRLTLWFVLVQQPLSRRVPQVELEALTLEPDNPMSYFMTPCMYKALARRLATRRAKGKEGGLILSRSLRIDLKLGSMSRMSRQYPGLLLRMSKRPLGITSQREGSRICRP